MVVANLNTDLVFAGSKMLCMPHQQKKFQPPNSISAVIMKHYEVCVCVIQFLLYHSNKEIATPQVVIGDYQRAWISCYFVGF